MEHFSVMAIMNSRSLEVHFRLLQSLLIVMFSYSIIVVLWFQSCVMSNPNQFGRMLVTPLTFFTISKNLIVELLQWFWSKSFFFGQTYWLNTNSYRTENEFTGTQFYFQCCLGSIYGMGRGRVLVWASRLNMLISLIKLGSHQAATLVKYWW